MLPNRKNIILLSTFYFLLLTQVIGQNADCDKMVIVKGPIYQTKPISGYGDKKEFEGNELENKTVFEEEKNSIWYLLTIPTDGVFTFDIKTNSKLDDWDFLLYEYKKMFCKRIEAKKIIPIRSNLSRSPITGLARSAKENFVGAGINDNYSRFLQVHKGEKYVLVVNNPKKSGGKHTLILHYPKIKSKKVEVTEKKIEKIETQKVHFKLTIRDGTTKKPLLSEVNITGLKKEVIELNSITSYEIQLQEKNYSIDINAYAKGYMLTSKEFKIRQGQSNFEAEVTLEKIKIGNKANLKNIQFYGNKADFLPTAKNSLVALLSFMKMNSEVMIEVEGHVNGPHKSNTKDYKDLSYSRAYAVKAYLIKNGIDDKRIDFKGYGNSKMLYPDPKSELQGSANRRVEIKIVSNEYHSGD